ncbi:MAG: 3-isopropylmalate dehydratase large subunit [Eubacteriaceae bacterium]|jgi:3-isopropylmalate/(R)-2-methylmalate dehydratase large subunit|nr:3-isopropylmalate dehydratase large subunit [Eubacteriaceae bacterium]
MGKTMSEKIIARAAGVDSVSADDIVWVNVDRAMMDDILGPRVQIADGMKEIHDKVWDPEKVVIISDHYTPPASEKQAEIVNFTRKWAAAHGIDKYYEFQGPCHQIMAETGNVIPGSIVLGTDSHTCMGGAFGAFASGIGSTEMMGILITGKTWLRVPRTIKVRWEGILGEGVMAKDVSLYTIGSIGHAGATYMTVEYTGDTIWNMSLDERMCISNMAVEMGAKAGLMEADEKTIDFLKAHDADLTNMMAVTSDRDASFYTVKEYAADRLEPMVACPHAVDNVHPVSELTNQKVDQAYLGSCTGGRYNDLKAASRILKGKKIHKGVRLLVSPASTEVWKRADKDGILADLVESGATVLGPTCGVCVGVHSGLIAGGETCISSSNRNFIGRMGSKQGNIYLGSPMTVAASALQGQIADPRDYL